MNSSEFHYIPRTAIAFGAGSFERLGWNAQQIGFKRVLLVADPGVAKAGYASRAVKMLWDAGLTVFAFHDFGPNPDTAMVQRCVDYASPLGVDSIIGLGGGSSMDLAKAANFLLTNGGTMLDYRGYGRATRDMLPMIGIPTTAGTGSEAQSYCIISDSDSHMKMACGDPKAAFRIAVLDPSLTVSQPADVTAAAGYDALSHAVESFVTTKRNALSQMYAREAFRLIEPSFEKVLSYPADLDARGAMLLGAHLAGMAIESSMLGATHACANPLTAHFGTTHGVAIAMLLRHVVRWNSSHADYSQLHPGLAERLGELAQAAAMPASLQAAGVDPAMFETLAQEAAVQWTGQHNPRPFDAAGAMEIYQCAY